MGKLIYSMGMSLDGFVEGPDGGIDWGVPDEELHRFHNRRVGRLGAHLLGRRLYEVMRVWDVRDDWDTAVEREFAEIWRALPKVVFSRTLSAVEGNARLATGDVPDEVAALKEQTDEDVEVGGAGLAADCARLGLIDEYHVFVHPVVLGGGKPFFAHDGERRDLELLDVRTFGNRVVHLRYGRA